MSVTIYHNPRCSKSRQTLALLQDKGIEPEIVEYLKTPPSAAELKKILGQLGMAPRELMRKGEAAYKERGLKDASKSGRSCWPAARPASAARPSRCWRSSDRHHLPVSPRT